VISAPAPESWVTDLEPGAPQRPAMLRRLHELLLSAALREAHRRAAGTPISGVELRDLAEHATNDATLAILAKLKDFRGDSLFTTWAYKFVILEVASKVTRHSWQTKPITFQPPDWEQLPSRFGFTLQETIEHQELLAAVRDGIEQVLTVHQRRVFVAIVLRGVPLDVLTGELSMTRNAIYKTVFDARRKLRGHLVANGYEEFE
jgi:RNA polymerase sigma-70 factor, ECF subfamily